MTVQIIVTEPSGQPVPEYTYQAYDEKGVLQGVPMVADKEGKSAVNIQSKDWGIKVGKQGYADNQATMGSYNGGYYTFHLFTGNTTLPWKQPLNKVKVFIIASLLAIPAILFLIIKKRR